MKLFHETEPKKQDKFVIGYLCPDCGRALEKGQKCPECAKLAKAERG